MFFFLDSVPTYVRARGSKALAAYRKGLEEGGSTYDTRVKISLIGQDRVGKTSLGKSLRGELFDKFERSTNGVQMFSFVMNAGTEAWKNPDYLQDVTVFDQKVSEEATKELRKAEYQPMAKNLSDEHEELEQVQDETEEASSEGKYLEIFFFIAPNKNISANVASYVQVPRAFSVHSMTYLC